MIVMIMKKLNAFILQQFSFTTIKTDILLNVFLAIAVDNLGDAEEMDAIEKEKEEAENNPEAGNPQLDEEKEGTDEEYANEEGYSSEG